MVLIYRVAPSVLLCVAQMDLRSIHFHQVCNSGKVYEDIGVTLFRAKTDPDLHSQAAIIKPTRATTTHSQVRP